MSRSEEINILLADRCSKREADYLLKAGTVIWEKPEEWIDNLRRCGCLEGQTIEKALNKEIEDISPVFYGDHLYLIEYYC